MIFPEMNNDQFKRHYKNMLKAMDLKNCQISNCENVPTVHIKIYFRNANPDQYEVPWGLSFDICKDHVGLFHRTVKSITDIPIV